MVWSDNGWLRWAGGDSRVGGGDSRVENSLFGGDSHLGGDSRVGGEKGHLRKLNGGFPGSLPPPFSLISLEIAAAQSLYVPEKTREDWVVSLGSLEESVGRGSRFRRGIVGH